MYVHRRCDIQGEQPLYQQQYQWRREKPAVWWEKHGSVWGSPAFLIILKISFRWMCCRFTSLFVCVCCVGGDGHQSNGVFSAEQPRQLLQPDAGQQRTRGGRKQWRGAQENRAGDRNSSIIFTYCQITTDLSFKNFSLLYIDGWWLMINWVDAD